MDNLAQLLAYLLSSMGLTVVLVWPQAGPSAWLRERVLKAVLPARAAGVLDCYICFGFWAGLLLSLPWCWLTRRWWYGTGCLMVPALFWMFQQGD
jgi:hypothetical protein